MVDATGAIESAYIFDLNIFHMLVFSHSFFVDFEAHPELRKRRRGFQKMRVVLRHNELVTRMWRHPAIEQRSKSAENPPRIFRGLGPLNRFIQHEYAAINVVDGRMSSFMPRMCWRRCDSMPSVT